MTFTGSRWLRIAPAFAVVVLASLGVVGAISERDAISNETHARGREIVEAMGVAHVLEPSGERGPAPHPLTACDVADSARHRDRVVA